MSVVLLVEYDNPKDDERSKKMRKFGIEVMGPYWEKLVKEKDIKLEYSPWADNTGRTIRWIKFETMDDFAKMWDDERYQNINARWASFVDNMRIRLLRPAIRYDKLINPV